MFDHQPLTELALRKGRSLLPMEIQSLEIPLFLLNICFLDHTNK